MASLAVLLKNRGHRITGSDENIYPPMSDLLAENGIEVFTPYHRDNLKPHPDFVVLGNVLSRGNPEVEYALESHLHYLSMAELLKNEFIRGNKSVVITGTHGKTTTTSLAAHVFHQCGKPTGFMVGGVPENFGTSSKDVEKGGYFIVEGDEYDTSFFDKRSKFFHYLPDLLVINNIEFDHADIFSSIDDIKRSFSLMLRQMPGNGLILVNGDDDIAVEVAKTGFSPYITFGTGEDCDAVIRSQQPLVGELGMKFNLLFEEKESSWKIPLLGEFNIRNATAAILLALNQGISPGAIQSALSGFKNVKRRLQQLTRTNEIRVFDDFAHHPTAIEGTIAAIRNAWPQARIHAIFEARSNTAVRRYHQNKMARAFSQADTVTFYKLHREQNIPPEERLDVKQLISELGARDIFAQQLESHDSIVEYCVNTAKPSDIVVVMSNGAFGGIQYRIAEEMDKKC